MLSDLETLLTDTAAILKRSEIQTLPNLRIQMAVFFNLLTLMKIQVLAQQVKVGDFLLE